MDVAVFCARLSVQCPDMVEMLMEMNERNIAPTLVPEFHAISCLVVMN